MQAVLRFPPEILELHLVIFSSLFLYGILLFSGVHVTLESLMKDNQLKTTIKDLVRGSGRSYPVGENEVQVNEETAATSTEKQLVPNGDEKLPVASELTGIPQKETLAVH